MTNLLDYILDLFRSPSAAANYIQDPSGALRSAGLQNVSAAQFQAVAASAAPAGVFLGGGDPVQGLQHAVANYHNIPSAFSPQTAFAPQTDFASHNATELASNNDTSLLSPDQHAGSNAQQGAVNLGFGDITLGDKTSNSATNGGVVNTGEAGDIDTTSVNGNGNVVGDGNDANTGTILAGDHSSTNIGDGNDTAIKDSSQHAGGDVISGNDGPVIKDVDMSGGHGGSASSSGGGGLLGIGNGGNEANAGSGGGGGSIVLVDDHTSSVGGNQTTTEVGGDISGTGGIDNSQDSSVHVDDHSQSEVLTQVDDHSTSNHLEDNTTIDAGLF